MAHNKQLAAYIEGLEADEWQRTPAGAGGCPDMLVVDDAGAVPLDITERRYTVHQQVSRSDDLFRWVIGAIVTCGWFAGLCAFIFWSVTNA